MYVLYYKIYEEMQLATSWTALESIMLNEGEGQELK